MAVQIKIKRAYITPACDIFQIDQIENQILNNKQVATLVNLNVFDKWCIKLKEGEINVGDYVICIDHETINYFGNGWRRNYVFVVTSIDDFDDESKMIFGGVNGCGVLSQGLRLATEQEIEEIENLPF